MCKLVCEFLERLRRKSRALRKCDDKYRFAVARIHRTVKWNIFEKASGLWQTQTSFDETSIPPPPTPRTHTLFLGVFFLWRGVVSWKEAFCPTTAKTWGGYCVYAALVVKVPVIYISSEAKKGGICCYRLILLCKSLIWSITVIKWCFRIKI